MIAGLIRYLLRANLDRGTATIIENSWQQSGVGGKSKGPLAGFIALVTTGATTQETDAEALDPRFKPHYDHHIRHHVEAFEARRIKTLNKLRKRCFLAIPALVIIAAAGFTIINSPRQEAATHHASSHAIKESSTTSGSPVNALLGFMAFVVVSWASSPVWGYKGGIREIIFPDVFSYFGDEWRYRSGDRLGTAETSSAQAVLAAINKIAETQSAGGRSLSIHRQQSTLAETTRFTEKMQAYKPYGIVPGHNSAYIHDQLSGDYKAVQLGLEQCTLISGHGKSSQTVFRGLLVTIDVPKRFSSHTVVKRDGGAVGNWFGKQFGALPSVKLEDPRFEQRYEVYGSDQVEARYLLTTTFMERLIELEDLFATRNGGRCEIKCAFKDGKLLFTIPTTKEWFQTGSIFKPANFIPEINLILKEMDQLFAIIEVLKLDDRSGL